jgi:hypothetical protein
MKGETKHEVPTMPLPNVGTLQSPFSPSPQPLYFSSAYYVEEWNLLKLLHGAE